LGGILRRRLAALVLLLAFLPLLLTAPSQVQSGQAPSAADRKAALERLRSTAGGRVEARWTEDHGRIRTLSGRLAPPRAGAPEDLARTFLLEARDLFALRPDLDDLTLRGARSSPGGTHVGFEAPGADDSGRAKLAQLRGGSLRLLPADEPRPIGRPRGRRLQRA
jgi:hypothetical protein